MVKEISILFVLLLILIPVIPSTIAQDDSTSCTNLVTDALQLTGSACAEMGINEACYGHSAVLATFQDGADTTFETSGDLVTLETIEALFTQPADPDAGTWGIALMNVQADLTNDAMTLVLFGDAEVTSANIQTGNSGCTAENNNDFNINIRSGPSTEGEIVGVFGASDNAVVIGRNAASDWLRINYDGTEGWVSAPLVTTDCDSSTLPEASDESVSNMPMQAINLQTRESDTCENAPDGLLVRSPEGQRAGIVVNGVEMVFSSTGFISTAPDETLTIHGLVGSIDITAQQETVSVTANTLSTVPIHNFEPQGPPTEPEPFQPDGSLLALQAVLPGSQALSLLPTQVPVPEEMFAAFDLSSCSQVAGEGPIRAGYQVRLDLGSRPYVTQEEAEAGFANVTGVIIVESTALNVYFQPPDFHPEPEAANHPYWFQLSADWYPQEAGTYSISAAYPGMMFTDEVTPVANTCTVVVEDAISTDSGQDSSSGPNEPLANRIDVDTCFWNFDGEWPDPVSPDVEFRNGFGTESDDRDTLDPIINGGVSYQLSVNGVDQGPPVESNPVYVEGIGCWVYIHTWQRGNLPSGTHTVSSTATFQTTLTDWQLCEADFLVNYQPGDQETVSCTFTVP